MVSISRLLGPELMSRAEQSSFSHRTEKQTRFQLSALHFQLLSAFSFALSAPFSFQLCTFSPFQLSALHFQPLSAFSFALSALHFQLSALHFQLSALHFQLSALHFQLLKFPAAGSEQFQIPHSVFWPVPLPLSVQPAAAMQGRVPSRSMQKARSSPEP